MSSEKNKYQLIIGRHCLVRNPDFLLGAVQEALSYGANALMIYLGAPQNSFRQPVSKLKVAEFKEFCQSHLLDINNVVVHAPYLLNLANITNEKIFHWSAEFLKEEIKRMEEIGLNTIVLHPGSALDAKIEDSLSQFVRGINSVLSESSTVRIALETMCGRKNEIGGNFEQLKYIIDRVNYKERIGVCWDTCHLYTAGYDIKNKLEEVIKEFDEKIGLDKLWVIHVNDSVFELGEKRDRHENLGYGKIGWETLKKIVWHPQLDGKIKLLETPRQREEYRTEIKKLKEN
jgi:deoxyribonuclease-4